MSNVVQFARPVASVEVVEKLVELGYLKGTKHRNVDAILDALARLQEDLCRAQTIRICDPLHAEPQTKVVS
jgi:hypothetical protein